jgi:peptidoglycan/xylan/chitin deacetylase (PgdA/CDA1 family)
MKTAILKFADKLNLYPLFNPFTRNTATVFMLHSIAPGPNDYGALPAGTLRDLLRYLKDNNYRVISLSEYVSAIIHERETYKTVVFTVDDGYRDFYLHAFHIFKEFGYPATIFITSDFIEKRMFMWWDAFVYCFINTKLDEIDLSDLDMGKIRLTDPHQRASVAVAATRYCKKQPHIRKLELIDIVLDKLDVDISRQPQGIYEPLSWPEIKEMHQGGIEFHPHTKTHPIISKVTREQKIVEIEEPKRILESQLNDRADIFCYPNGQAEDFDEETIEILKKAGYIAAVTGIPGFDNTKKHPDLFRLSRYAIPDRLIIFKQYVSGLEVFKTRIRI